MNNYRLNGSCHCGHWKVQVSCTKPFDKFNPRVCDCDYCQKKPSQIISDPNLIANFVGGTSKTIKNGDQLANFYYCDGCNDLLAVGCELDGTLRGAVNVNLLGNIDQFGDPVNIQPRLLSAEEKKERWGKLWGELIGLSH